MIEKKRFKNRKISFSPKKNDKKKNDLLFLSKKKISKSKSKTKNYKNTSRDYLEKYISKTNHNSLEKKNSYYKKINNLFNLKNEVKKKIDFFPKKKKKIKYKKRKIFDKKKNFIFQKKDKKKNKDEKNDFSQFCINHKNINTKFLLKLTELKNKKIGFCLECGFELKKKGFVLEEIKMSKKNSKFFVLINDLYEKINFEISKFQILEIKIEKHEFYLKKIFDFSTKKICGFFEKLIDLFLFKKKILLDNFENDFENEKDCLNEFKKVISENLEELLFLKKKMEKKQKNLDFKKIEKKIDFCENLGNFKFHKFEIFPNIDSSLFCKTLNKYYEKLWKNHSNLRKKKLMKKNSKKNIKKMEKKNIIEYDLLKNEKNLNSQRDKKFRILNKKNHFKIKKMEFLEDIKPLYFNLSKNFNFTSTNYDFENQNTIEKNPQKLFENFNQKISEIKSKISEKQLNLDSNFKKKRSKKNLHNLKIEKTNLEKESLLKSLKNNLIKNLEKKNSKKKNLEKNYFLQIELDEKGLNSENERKSSNFNYSDIKSKITILTKNLLKGNFVNKNLNTKH